MNRIYRYIGQRSMKMTPDHRVCVPKDWRPEGEDCLFIQFSTNYGLPFLKVFGREHVNEVMERISQCGRSEAEKNKLRNLFARHCIEVKLGKDSRITIPSHFRDLAGMPPAGEVILLGCGFHFEIWNKQNYEAIPRDQDDDVLGIF